VFGEYRLCNSSQWGLPQLPYIYIYIHTRSRGGICSIILNSYCQNPQCSEGSPASFIRLNTIFFFRRMDLAFDSVHSVRCISTSVGSCSGLKYLLSLFSKRRLGDVNIAEFQRYCTSRLIDWLFW
jgi:hypothetical protein